MEKFTLFLGISIVGIGRGPSTEEKRRERLITAEKKLSVPTRNKLGGQAFSKFSRFRSCTTKFRGKVILSFLTWFSPVDAHNYSYAYSVCVQGSLKFSSVAFFLQEENRKKLRFHWSLFVCTTHPAQSFCLVGFWTFASKSLAFFWSRVKGKNAKEKNSST